MSSIPRFKHATLSLRFSHARCSCSPRLVGSVQQYRNLPIHSRCLHTDSTCDNDVPFRKQLKEEARQKRAAERRLGQDAAISDDQRSANQFRLDKWKLTVGLEIHAQLNTDCKLFSGACSSNEDSPNLDVVPFDLAFPGSQPQFQHAALIPALRAAVGLRCAIQEKSTFDRKHYYYQDQPAGYQLTQYYQPFATNGRLTLYDYDGIATPDGKSVEVDIKQIQMEQDTAKSTLRPPSTALLDFKRVGHPLIEIITLPVIHHPRTAAACARKIQAILQAVNANTTGMEMGGLRADVNVSVSPQGSDQLGQRTEIKNLSSFKAVEDAIIAERDRQIALLEAGESIIGETRGWTLGDTETKRLRGKEGEVDYRYMPDPDILPLFIGDDVVHRIMNDLPELPDDTIGDLTENYGLSCKDAKTLVSLDYGGRLDYFDQVSELCFEEFVGLSVGRPRQGQIIGNWVLHELGGLLNSSSLSFSSSLVPARCLADILINLAKERITGTTAKRLLAMVFNGDKRPVEKIVTEDNMGLNSLSREQYISMAQKVLDEHPTKVKQIVQKGQLGKLQFFVGEMMRRGQGTVEASKAEATLRELLDLDRREIRAHLDI